MLEIPCVGERFVRSLTGGRSKADLDCPNSASLHAGEPFDWPRELVVQPGLAQWENAASEALDHSNFIRTKCVESVQDEQGNRSEQHRSRQLAAAIDDV